MKNTEVVTLWDFPRFLAKPASIKNRKPVHGVGINNANYTVTTKINNKRVICPAYRSWLGMLERGYCSKYKARQPSYKNVYVCEYWLTFSNYLSWFDKNYVKGWHLDKDIKTRTSKVYSQETCIFVPQEVNNLILDNNAFRGEYPLGVSLHKPTKKYRADVTSNSKQKNLGLFKTVEEAYFAYKAAKNVEIVNKMVKFPCLAVYLKEYLHSDVPQEEVP